MYDIFLFITNIMVKIWGLWLVFEGYFPIQKLRKIFPKTSSVEISPVISPR
jgi:hypothetical protein